MLKCVLCVVIWRLPPESTCMNGSGKLLNVNLEEIKQRAPTSITATELYRNWKKRGKKPKQTKTKRCTNIKSNLLGTNNSVVCWTEMKGLYTCMEKLLC